MIDKNNLRIFACDFCESSIEVSNLVVSRGNPRARLMIIGEAPGAQENKKGEPFVGRSGKLLDSLLEIAGFVISKEVYISNLVKTRPPNNRRPSKKEILVSSSWLNQQIKLVDPWIIVLAGSTALETFLGKKIPISTVRGRWLNWEGRMIMPIFHPSYLLRNPLMKDISAKSLTINDLLEVHNKLRTYDLNTSMTYFSNESGHHKS